MKGYSAASFSNRAIDSLLSRGKVAALHQWSEIVQLKEKIGISPEDHARNTITGDPGEIVIRNIIIRGCRPRKKGGTSENADAENSVITLNDIHRRSQPCTVRKPFRRLNYRLLGNAPYDLELNLKSNPMSAINIGFRFDSEDMAAILLNTTLNYRGFAGFSIIADRTIE